MPTSRSRYMLTATDEIAEALRRAAERWPEDADRPTRLLARLIAAGDERADSERADSMRRRSAAIRETSGAFTGLYPQGHLEALRREWPA